MVARLRYNPRFMVSAVLLALILIFALIGPLGRDPFKVVGGLFNPPSGGHWLGTDNFGHDVLSQLMAGTRTSLIIGVIAGAVATLARRRGRRANETGADAPCPPLLCG